MNDLQHTFDIHCQNFFKTNFRFDATFYIPKVGQVCYIFKEMLLQSLAKIKSPLDKVIDDQRIDKVEINAICGNFQVINNAQTRLKVSIININV